MYIGGEGFVAESSLPLISSDGYMSHWKSGTPSIGGEEEREGREKKSMQLTRSLESGDDKQDDGGLCPYSLAMHTYDCL
jgi:hypothetical protein